MARNKPYRVTFEIEGPSLAKVMNRALVMLYKSDTEANSVEVVSKTGERQFVGSPVAKFGDTRDIIRELGITGPKDITDAWAANKKTREIPHGEVGHD